MYSLCAKYYDKEFATVDELMNDVTLGTPQDRIMLCLHNIADIIGVIKYK